MFVAVLDLNLIMYILFGAGQEGWKCNLCL